MNAPRSASSTDAGDKPIGSETPKPEGPPLVSMDSAIFKDVQLSLQASLGQTSLTIAELLALKAGAVLTLDLKMNDLIDLRLNQAVVARGEIVAVGDNFGVRIVDVAALS